MATNMLGTDVLGWRREAAEAALRDQGVECVETVVTTPPRGRATGSQRVVRQRAVTGGVVLTVAAEQRRDDVRRR